MAAIRILFVLTLFVFPLFVFAQADESAANEEAAKENLRQQSEFLEQALGDAKNLRLPENRAFVFAKVGNALWQTDEKRARQLFQSAISELIAGQNAAGTEKVNQQNLVNLIYGQSPRWEILYVIANRDADFALDAMTKTRPPKLVHALDKLKADTQSQSQQFARNEVQSEQRLIGKATEQNPQRAIQLLRESLKKNVSYDTLNLLKKILEKDEEIANQLAEEVGQKLLDTPFNETNQDSSFIQYFLNEFARAKTTENKSIRVSDALIRSLAEKIVKFSLRPNTTSIYFNDSAMKIIEVFFPSAVAEIKQRQAKIQNQNQSEEYKNYNKLMQGDASAEELLSQVEKLPAYQRNDIYRRAAEKTAQSGNISQAQAILNDNLSEEEAVRYLSQFNYNLSNQAASQGKFAEAAALINQIPDENTQLSALIYLASTIYQKDPKENQSQAAAVLQQARTLIPDAPEKISEMNSLLTIAGGYVEIEPAESFRLTESIIPALNEYSEASAIVAKFNDSGNFRQGEYKINEGGNIWGVYNLSYLLQRLKNADFERTVRITRNFNRLDIRLSLQLQLIDSVVQLPLNSRRGNFILKSK